jgi:hypothetical protein
MLPNYTLYETFFQCGCHKYVILFKIFYHLWFQMWRNRPIKVIQWCSNWVSLEKELQKRASSISFYVTWGIQKNVHSCYIKQLLHNIFIQIRVIDISWRPWRIWSSCCFFFFAILHVKLNIDIQLFQNR